MSGAVDFVKKTASNVVDDVKLLPKQPLKAVGGLMSNYVGTVTGGIIGGSVTRGAALGATDGTGVVKGSMNSAGGQITHDTILGKVEAPQNISVIDPAQVAKDNETKRQAAARQAQIDQQTGTPGRGGTILTDNYSYRT